MSTCGHEKIRFTSVLVADSKVGNEENWHISDLDVYFRIKYHQISVN